MNFVQEHDKITQYLFILGCCDFESDPRKMYFTDSNT